MSTRHKARTVKKLGVPAAHVVDPNFEDLTTIVQLFDPTHARLAVTVALLALQPELVNDLEQFPVDRAPYVAKTMSSIMPFGGHEIEAVSLSGTLTAHEWTYEVVILASMTTSNWHVSRQTESRGTSGSSSPRLLVMLIWP